MDLSLNISCCQITGYQDTLAYLSLSISSYGEGALHTQGPTFYPSLVGQRIVLAYLDVVKHPRSCVHLYFYIDLCIQTQPYDGIYTTDVPTFIGIFSSFDFPVISETVYAFIFR